MIGNNTARLIEVGIRAVQDGASSVTFLISADEDLKVSPVNGGDPTPPTHGTATIKVTQTNGDIRVESSRTERRDIAV